MKFEIYSTFEHVEPHGATGRLLWYWRLRARNGRVIADGAEAYATRRNVMRAVSDINALFATFLPIKEVEA